MRYLKFFLFFIFLLFTSPLYAAPPGGPVGACMSGANCDSSNFTTSLPSGTSSVTHSVLFAAEGTPAQAFGAKCDGSTDDTTALNAALSSGATRIIIPPGVTCFSATGITVPDGVTLAGMSFHPGNAPTGSEILCAANISQCVTLSGHDNKPARLEQLIVATNATLTPTAGACVYTDRAYNATLRSVMVYNCYDGYYWKGAGSLGLGGKMMEVYSGKIADAHIVVDGWPELRIDNSRFGMNGSGDIAATAFIRLTGGVGGTQGGPNTIYAINSQFNQGAASVSHWLQFINCGGTCVGGASSVNATEFVFADDHVENIGSDFITSDSTWNTISYLGIQNSTLLSSGVPFWNLNAATTLANTRIVGSQIITSTFTLAPTPQLNDVVFTGNSIQAAVSLTSNSSASTLGFLNNTVFGNVTLAGAWAALSVIGGDMRSGTLTNTATGGVIYNVPGVIEPYFQAHLAAAQSVTKNTNTKINFDTVDYDSKSWWSAANHRYVPQVPGKYLVTLSIRMTITGTPATGDFINSWSPENGTTVAGENFVRSQAAQTFEVSPVSETVLSFNGSTDYVEGWVFCSTTAGTCSARGSDGNGYATYITIKYLGP